MKLIRFTNKSNVKIRADPLHALKFLRTLGRVLTIWPVDPKTNSCNKFFNEFSLWLIIMNLFITVATLLMSLLSIHNNPVLMTRTLSQLMILSDSFTHLILYKINRSDLQILLQEIFNFMESCNRNEKSVITEYYKSFLVQYSTLIVLYASAALAFLCGAFVLNKKFPMDTFYPFSTDSVIVISVIYVQQIFGIIQNSVIIMIDFLVIILFWYAGARIKVLGRRLMITDTDKQLRQCIIDHQYIIRFVQNSVNTARLIAYKTISIVTIILISAGLQLLYNDAKTVISQFSLVYIVASLRIITYSSTIDEMKKLNENLRWIIYRSDWLRSSLNTNQNLLIFIHRCQIPLVIVNGRMLNIMTLNFFAKFMYTTLSQLTTFRAIIERST